eukprot:CAMPEP_0170484874 /NCGR_PEP_ID=MMETSP0208-20121228/4249_1 /TAXON_ID=197538 /ORGANISM="Strombidium inclinatum, Strain S3" /LENGTH=141 /DNA_ID=CAMNT_0010758329 /DNA_START=1 /DNA_END=423 /DNA_ORIENTATION=-
MGEEGGDFGDKLFVVPEGLDFQNSCLVFLFLGVLAFEVIYFCLPRIGQKQIERLDFNKKAGHKMSYSGIFSLIVLAFVAITQGQVLTSGVDSDEKLSLSIEEKAFRYRQKFMSEITMFILVLILSVVLTMNHSMSVNRKKA